MEDMVAEVINFYFFYKCAIIVKILLSIRRIETKTKHLDKRDRINALEKSKMLFYVYGKLVLSFKRKKIWIQYQI